MEVRVLYESAPGQVAVKASGSASERPPLVPPTPAEDEGEHPEPEVQREGKEEEEERVGSDCAEEIFARMAQYPYIPIGKESIGFHLAIRGQQRQQEG
jgi:hypothetical protein